MITPLLIGIGVALLIAFGVQISLAHHIDRLAKRFPGVHWEITQLRERVAVLEARANAPGNQPGQAEGK